jgi:hypothetical protein
VRKSHAEKLIPTRKTPHAILASVTRHATPKFVSGNEIHQLRNTVLPAFISHPSRGRRMANQVAPIQIENGVLLC